MKLRILSFLLCLAVLASLTPACLADSSAPQVQALADSVLASQLQAAGAADPQAWLNGSLADTAGMGAEWFVFAFSQQGDYDFSAYQAKLRAYLAENKVPSASTRLKYALVLRATGLADPYVDTAMHDAIGQQGIMSWVYGLHMLTNGCHSDVVGAEEIVSTILSLQFADGGWALNGTAADVDVTAMTLQALAPYADRAEVSAAIDRALALLSQRQMEDGGFASYGRPNPESAAQVLIALCALGIDGLQDARFIKNGHTLLDAMAAYQLPDGSVSHLMGGPASQMAAVQVYMACLAWQRFTQGQPALYLLDHPLTQSEPQPITAPLGYKPIAVAVIAVLALIGCLLLLIRKKRSPKNYLAILAIAALLITGVLTTDIQSADSYYTTPAAAPAEPIGSVTLSIRCDTVKGLADHIPADGVILPETLFPIGKDDTVYSILTRAAQTRRIHLESSGAPGMVYVTGIANLYEFSYGDLSGWNYFVNGESASVGCDQYILKNGDVIEWHYTRALGEDLK